MIAAPSADDLASRLRACEQFCDAGELAACAEAVRLQRDSAPAADRRPPRSGVMLLERSVHVIRLPKLVRCINPHVVLCRYVSC